jgi:hypothetical protein
MKYIVYSDDGIEHLVQFPDIITHRDMADALEALRFGGDRDWHRRQGEIVSAGFVINGRCLGRSESLDVSSRLDLDTLILNSDGSLKENIL